MVLTELSQTDDRVIQWRVDWLRYGGFSVKNAEKLAKRPNLDWRYANQVLANAKAKGYSEAFVVKLLI